MYVVCVRVWVMVRAKVRNRVMVTARVRCERECKCDTNSLTHQLTQPVTHVHLPSLFLVVVVAMLMGFVYMKTYVACTPRLYSACRHPSP